MKLNTLFAIAESLLNDLRNQYTVDTPLKVIFEDEEAMKLIEENMPELLRVSLHMQIKSIREIKELESGPMSKKVADKINAMLKCQQGRF